MRITETGAVSESGVASPSLSTYNAAFKHHITPLLLPHVLLCITQQPGQYTASLIIHCSDISQNTRSIILPLYSQGNAWVMTLVKALDPLYCH